jgi:DHA1 family tetracycline resistance protein-like MFS transporter
MTASSFKSNFMKTHPLFVTLKSLRGNVRGCVLTEPLWGIPYNLYAPYISVYMLALGLVDSQIGFITSVSLVGQFFNSLLSGAITDKYGRKRTTLVSDIIAWSIPCFIWAIAQDFRYFLIAAIINSVWRVSMTSWSCLLVEDTEPRLLIDVYSLIYMSGYIAAFFTPIAGLLIERFTLVPTMRALYFLAFIMMTLKFLVMNNMVTETNHGKVRLEETHRQSMFSLLREYRGVLKQILRTPVTLYTLSLMIIMSIGFTVSGTFWSILVTQELMVPESYLAIFSTFKSLILLIFFFILMPRIRELDARKPMALGFAFFILSQLLIITMPPQAYLLIIVAVILEACAVPMTSTLLDKLIVISIDPKERARIMAILYVTVLAFTSPFGWIAGQLSQINRELPFILSITLFCIAILLILLTFRFPHLYAGHLHEEQPNVEIAES